MRSSTPLTNADDSRGAEPLRELDGLVDHDLDRHVAEREQLARAEPQDVAIDARHPIDAPVLRRATRSARRSRSTRSTAAATSSRANVCAADVDLELELVGPADRGARRHRSPDLRRARTAAAARRRGPCGAYPCVIATFLAPSAPPTAPGTASRARSPRARRRSPCCRPSCRRARAPARSCRW